MSEIRALKLIHEKKKKNNPLSPSFLCIRKKHSTERQINTKKGMHLVEVEIKFLTLCSLVQTQMKLVLWLPEI